MLFTLLVVAEFLIRDWDSLGPMGVNHAAASAERAFESRGEWRPLARLDRFITRVLIALSRPAIKGSGHAPPGHRRMSCSCSIFRAACSTAGRFRSTASTRAEELIEGIAKATQKGQRLALCHIRRSFRPVPVRANRSRTMSASRKASRNTLWDPEMRGGTKIGRRRALLQPKQYSMMSAAARGTIVLLTDEENSRSKGQENGWKEAVCAARIRIVSIGNRR